ncbi:MAG: hypothetical protein LUI02_00980 [Clostridiales bacterium]|nr:hypothetical protein [Clostridiales bacterium]
MYDTYKSNTMARYVQAIISSDAFFGELCEWLSTLDDERMGELRHFLFEVDLSDIEGLKDSIYKYGGYLSEKNYMGRKFFAHMALMVQRMELMRRTAAVIKPMPAPAPERELATAQ